MSKLDQRIATYWPARRERSLADSHPTGLIVLAALVLLALDTASFAQNNPLHFLERTQIVEATALDQDQLETTYRGVDNSPFLGDPSFNFATTRDSAVADVNQDGFLDIVETSPFGIPLASSGTIIRINNQSGGFDVISGDPSSLQFIAAIALVDLNNDNYPDLIAGGDFFSSGQQVQVFFNTQSAVSNYFDLSAPDFVAPMTFCPSGITVGDLDKDGAADFAVAQRTLVFCAFGQTSLTSVFYNKVIDNNGVDPLFVEAQLSAPSFVSTHDVVFIDANNDTYLDVVTVNEFENSSQLFLNDGTTVSTVAAHTFTHAMEGFAGSAGDLNGDGFTDLVLTGVARPPGVVPFTQGLVYLNDGTDPASFSSVIEFLNINGDGNFLKDIQLGDIDLDGNVDILSSTMVPRTAAHSGIGGVRTFLSSGGTLPSYITDPSDTTPIVPNNLFAQSTAIELIDFDQDGDLDVYTVGGSDQRMLPNSTCDGCLPNQFFENLTVAPDADGDGLADVADNCPAVANAGQEDADFDGTGDVCDIPCQDGLDNDNDNLIDAQDPGCGGAFSATKPEDPGCDDGIDNDNNGLTDYPLDPSCQAPWLDEPVECRDGLDNDDDGLIDADDPGCGNVWGVDESAAPPACGLGFEIGLVLLPLMMLRRRRESQKA